MEEPLNIKPRRKKRGQPPVYNVPMECHVNMLLPARLYEAIATDLTFNDTISSRIRTILIEHYCASVD